MTVAVEPQTNIDYLWAAARGAAPMPAAAELLGWRPLELERGRIRVAYGAKEAWYNPQGAVQGGFIAAMLDDAMGPALFTALEPGQFAPTLELKVMFFRPLHAGEVVAEGQVVHRTKRVAFLEGRLYNEKGELAASATATASIGPMKNGEPNG